MKSYNWNLSSVDFYVIYSTPPRIWIFKKNPPTRKPFMINICYTNILSKILQIIKKRIGFSFINTKDQITMHSLNLLCTYSNLHVVWIPTIFDHRVHDQSTNIEKDRCNDAKIVIAH